MRDGKYASRVEIRKGDIGASNITRVEMAVTVPSSTKQEGAEIWYAWSALTPEDQPLTKGSHQIAYWEGIKVFKQVMAFSVDADNISFATNLPKYQQHWRGKFTPGKWHDFILHVKWSPDPAVGLVELFFRGS